MLKIEQPRPSIKYKAVTRYMCRLESALTVALSSYQDITIKADFNDEIVYVISDFPLAAKQVERTNMMVKDSISEWSSEAQASVDLIKAECYTYSQAVRLGLFVWSNLK